MKSSTTDFIVTMASPSSIVTALSDGDDRSLPREMFYIVPAHAEGRSAVVGHSPMAAVGTAGQRVIFERSQAIQAADVARRAQIPCSDWKDAQGGAEAYAVECFARGDIAAGRHSLERRAVFRDQQLTPAEMVAAVSR